MFYKNKIFDFVGEKFNNMREARKYIFKNLLPQPSKQTSELTQTKCMTGVGLTNYTHITNHYYILQSIAL